VKSVEDMTQAELGAFVQTHLRQSGTEVVLSGGAAVAIYSSDKYVSKDLDIVRTYAYAAAGPGRPKLPSIHQPRNGRPSQRMSRMSPEWFEQPTT
jgi:hypothetical protein